MHDCQALTVATVIFITDVIVIAASLDNKPRHLNCDYLTHLRLD